MKLSFIIPAYNEELLLGKCLESILDQISDRSSDIEIILVNNSSTDKTKEIAQSFKKVIVIDELQKGASYARQTGFLASTGELVAFIDADTILTAGWIDKVFAEFSKNKELVALSGPYIFYDSSLTYKFLTKVFYYLGYVSHIVFHKIFHIGAMLQFGNCAIKRSALSEIGGVDTSIEFYGDDTDIARRIQKIGEVEFNFNLQMYTSARRLASEGIFTAGWKYFINYFWVIFFKTPFTKNYNDFRPKN